MSKTIVLDDVVAASLIAALTAAGTPTPAPAPVPGTPPPPPPPVMVPMFVAPTDVAMRAKMTSDAKWLATAGRIASPSALNDSNVWLVGFNAGNGNATLSFAEFGGSQFMRNFALVRNRDAAALAKGTLMEPSLRFGTSVRLDPRIALEVGERYTVAVWNANPGVTSPMVAEFYF